MNINKKKSYFIIDLIFNIFIFDIIITNLLILNDLDYFDKIFMENLEFFNSLLNHRNRMFGEMLKIDIKMRIIIVIDKEERIIDIYILSIIVREFN